jgi:hypothetical protein
MKRTAEAGSVALKIACVAADFVRWLDASGDKCSISKPSFGSSNGGFPESSAYHRTTKVLSQLRRLSFVRGSLPGLGQFRNRKPIGGTCSD